MGSTISKPLVDLTAEEVANHVKNLGPKYAAYATELQENGIHGGFLMELNEEEFKETLEDSGISSRLHARLLTKEWKSAMDGTKSSTPPATAPAPPAPPKKETEKPPPKKQEIPTAPALPISFAPLQPSKDDAKQQQQQYQSLEAIQKFGLSKDLTDDEVTQFAKIADKVFEGVNPMYAAIHMIDPTGYATLGSKYTPVGGGTPETTRHHGDTQSICHQVILQETGDYITKRVPPDYIDWRCSPFCTKYTAEQNMPYYQSQIIKDPETNARIGVICTVSEEVYEPAKVDLLAQLAAETSALLQERQYLMQRNQQLRQQITYSEAEKQKMRSSK